MTAPIAFSGLVTESPGMARVAREISELGSHEISVLILGETGSGKERVARTLHEESPRRRRRFVAVNCGAIDPGTAMSTLFGHERGAFTGASTRRRGAFREADGGTLFLDEIGELTPDLQAALLRALETREVVPIGGDRPEAVDFRLLTATHRDLAKDVAAGRFREDLLYRVAVSVIRVPSLRRRPEDIQSLAETFLREACPRREIRFTPDALRALEGQRWPGNVRELRNAILRAVVRVKGDVIDREALALPGQVGMFGDESAPPARLVPPARVPPRRQRGELIGALERNSGNRTLAAMDLGIARSTLYARLKRLGLG
jgi:DNA-binding NtrC family response regulator